MKPGMAIKSVEDLKENESEKAPRSGLVQQRFVWSYRR